MEYIILRKTEAEPQRFGSMYPSKEDAIKDIRIEGSFILCGLIPINGKLIITHTQEFIKN